MNRPDVSEDEIEFAIETLKRHLRKCMEKHGKGSFVSQHEILGCLEEELLELKEAIRTNANPVASELLDVAQTALFGWICVINKKAEC
jgi:hypothetical protein